MIVGKCNSYPSFILGKKTYQWRLLQTFLHFIIILSFIRILPFPPGTLTEKKSVTQLPIIEILNLNMML